MIIAAVISENFSLIAENCVHGSNCLLTSCSKHNGHPSKPCLDLVGTLEQQPHRGRRL